MKEQATTNGSFISVGDGHNLYFQVLGNPAAKVPILYLHGGPGSGFKDSYVDGFDLERQQIILYDQRGAGRSTPFGDTAHNTTQDLVSDIDKLLDHLGINTVQLYGTSWGSTLALCYAIHAPKRVERMLIGGIFLGRESDMQYIYHDVQQQFPEVIERFLAAVPKDKRANYSDAVLYYHEAFKTAKGDELRKLVFEWGTHESSLSGLDYVTPGTTVPTEEEFDDKWTAMAILESHYFVNNCFLPDEYIINNIAAISHIPAVIVHGRYDMVCSPSSAVELAKAYGKKAKLHMLLAGHSRRDPVMREVLQAYKTSFLA